jgi:hypothetical protein
MDNKKKYAAEAIRTLQQSLEAVAPYQATELSKQQAVRELLPQIEALRAKGYSWTSVAAMLSEHGVPVSVAALRTYLRRAREEAPKGASPAAARRSRTTRAVASQPEPPPATVPSPSQGQPVTTAGKPQPSIAASAPVVAPQRATPAASRQQEPSRSSFVPRRDTDDI